MAGWTGWTGWTGWGNGVQRSFSESDPTQAIIALHGMESTGVLGGDRTFLRGEAVANALPELESKTRQSQLAWWSAGVRQQLAHFELTSSLRFEPPGNDGRAKLWHADVSIDASAAAAHAVTCVPVLSISRPSRAYFAGQVNGVYAKVQSVRVVGSVVQKADRLAEASAEMLNPGALLNAFVNFNPELMPATIELLELARGFTADVCQRFKHALTCPRPNDYAARVMPLIQTPAHGTLPMGHAAEVYAVVGVIARLMKVDSSTSNLLRSYAQRVAENRILLGVHFPVDASAGRLLGETMADYFCRLCVTDADVWNSATFDGSSLDPSDADSGDHVFREASALRPCSELAGCSTTPTAQVLSARPLLTEMWWRAIRELTAAGLLP